MYMFYVGFIFGISTMYNFLKPIFGVKLNILYTSEPNEQPSFGKEKFIFIKELNIYFVPFM